MAFEGNDVLAIAERVDARLSNGAWNTSALVDGDLDTATEVAVFALELAGKRRQARRGGRFGRLIVSFALAACVALSTFAAACDKPSATADETQTAINELPSASGRAASITQPARASPGLADNAATFTDLVLLDPGSDAQPWAVLQAAGADSPILVDRTGAGLDTVGATYNLAAQPILVGTRDGASQFLDPLQPATQTSMSTQPVAASSVEQQWSQDERYLGATRAISGQTTVLDAAYNAAAAADAGGTHTYLNGVVLRAEPDQPVISVIDKSLLESGAPTREEDVVYVAVKPSDVSSYNPGQVVNLRDVVMNQQQTDVNGQSTTLYTVDAAVDGAQVEQSGSVDLQSLLQPRLDRVDQDIAANDQASAGDQGAPTAVAASTPGPTQTPQTVIVRERSGPSFVDDFLIWMWLSNSGWYRGPSVIINNPPASPSRPSGSTYYSPPPATSGPAPSSVASAQAASRSTALQASRSAVSGQSSGTGGGVAATNKSASAASDAAGAATAKSAAVAGSVSAASTGKTASSVAPSSSTGSSTSSRSAGSTSAGARGSAVSSSSSSGSGPSSSSSSKGIGSSSSSSSSSSRGSTSGSSSGFGSSSGGKGISGASSSS